MRQYIISILLALQGLCAMAQDDSIALRISILTCAQGDQIYSAFGHSAIRVRCPERGFDRVYNYGTFDYTQPLFALKFARGYLDYALTVYNFRLFSYEYLRGKRQVSEQDLNLSPQQAQAMFAYLEWNALEENRYYRYNFLYDNCATKIRDILKKACGPDIQFPESNYDFTLRQSINSKISNMPWLRMGVSLLMGLPVDKKATSETAMFMPDYVSETLSHTTLQLNGGSVPLVGQTRVVIDYPPVETADWLTYVSPSLILWLILAAWAPITYLEIKKKRYSAWADATMMCLTGFLGIVVAMAWFMSEHTVCAYNLNILWLWPVHIVAAWKTKSTAKFWTTYYKAAAITCGIFAIAGPLMPQQYDVAFYPMLLIMTMRFARIGFCRIK